MNISCRALVEADLGAYKSLRDAMLQAHPDAFTSDAATEALRLPDSYRSRVCSPHYTFGAFDGQTLVGAISCERDQRMKVRHIGHIFGMMVAPVARGRGVGEALLEACIARSRETEGMQLLTLSVTASNEVARRLYLRAGFRSYGLLEHAIKVGDAYFAKELMSLAL